MTQHGDRLQASQLEVKVKLLYTGTLIYKYHTATNILLQKRENRKICPRSKFNETFEQPIAMSTNCPNNIGD